MSSVGLNEPTLRRLVEAQEAILSPSRFGDLNAWRRAVTRSAARALGADRSALLLPGLDGIAPLSAEDYDNDTPRQYLASFGRDGSADGGNRRAKRRGVVSRAMLFPGEIDPIRRLRHHNEVIRVARARGSLRATIPLVGQGLGAALYLHYDRPEGRRFGETDIAAIRILRPSLEAAVLTLLRRQALQRDLEHSLDAVVLIDAEGASVYRNAAADRMMMPRNEDCLMAAAAASAASCPGARRIRTPDPDREVASSAHIRVAGDEYHLVATLVDMGLAQVPMVAVTILKIGIDPGVLESACRVAGLTPRQGEVAAALARRCTNNELAEQLCISEHTARRHTEAVMGKLSVHSRRDVADALVRIAEGGLRR